MNDTLQLYDRQLEAARSGVRNHPAMRRLMDPELPKQTLLRFLIEYCALGVQITEPVDGWIRRAGARCKEVGLPKLGSSLEKHASHEAGHHLMFIDDVHQLTEIYNRSFSPALDARQLLDQAPTRKMREYIELHEATIAGDTPFCQVAIELEIEGLSVSVGPALLAHLESRLGREAVQALSFLTEHVAIDVGHTALNNKLLERLLEQRPDALEQLARTGQRAIQIYLDFFGECLERSTGTVQASPAHA